MGHGAEARSDRWRVGFCTRGGASPTAVSIAVIAVASS